MELKVILPELHIHETPLEKIKIIDRGIFIEFDDANEERWRICFCPYQALNTTTIDCVDLEQFLIDGKWQWHIMEVTNSEWINRLKKTLSQKDHTADFLDKAHHYIFPFKDEVVEVVAWDNFVLTKLENL